MPIGDIAARMKTSYWSVKGRIYYAKLSVQAPPPREDSPAIHHEWGKKWTTEEDDYLVQKVEQGLSTTTIAKLMRTQRAAVNKRMSLILPKKPAPQKFTLPRRGSYRAQYDDTDDSQSPGLDTSHPRRKSSQKKTALPDLLVSMGADQTPVSETVLKVKRSTRAKTPRYDTTFHDLDLHLPPTADDSPQTPVSCTDDEYSKNVSPTDSEASPLAISHKYPPAYTTRASGSTESDESNSNSQLGLHFVNTEAGPVEVDTQLRIVNLTVLLTYMSWTPDKFRKILANTKIGVAILHRREDFFDIPFVPPKYLPSSRGVMKRAPSRDWKLHRWTRTRYAAMLFMSVGLWNDEIERRLIPNDYRTDGHPFEGIIRPLYSDKQHSICPTCGLCFINEKHYFLHALHHWRGHPVILDCCLRPLNGPITKHTCYVQDAGRSPVQPKSTGTEYDYENLYTILDKPVEASMEDSCIHDWEIVYVSVRFSSLHERGQYEEYVRTLRKDYTEAYRPRNSHWGIVLLQPGGRSATKAVWSPEKEWDYLFGSAEGDAWETLPHEVGWRPSTGRVLILGLSLTGFTTNLQFLVTAREELAPLEIILGFKIRDSKDTSNPPLGQEVRNGKEWVFYSLNTLVDTLLGKCTKTPKYQRLIVTLFLMHMARLS